MGHQKLLTSCWLAIGSGWFGQRFASSHPLWGRGAGKKERWGSKITSLHARCHPWVKNHEELPFFFFFPFSHPKFGGFLHLQNARLKGGIQEHQDFPRCLLQGFPSNAFPWRKIFLFFFLTLAIFQWWLLVNVGFGLQNAPWLTMLIEASIKHPETPALGNHQLKASATSLQLC